MNTGCVRKSLLLRRYGMSYFLDPETGEKMWKTEADCKADFYGVDLIGEDDYGGWWGTDRAYWRLSSAKTLVTVQGYLTGTPWCWRFVATPEEARSYVMNLGATGVRIEEVSSVFGT